MILGFALRGFSQVIYRSASSLSLETYDIILHLLGFFSRDTKEKGTAIFHIVNQHGGSQTYGLRVWKPTVACPQE